MSDGHSDQDEIETTAAQWLIRSRAPDVSDDDVVALTVWLEASPAHVDAFARAEAAWLDGEAIAPYRPSTPDGVVVPIRAHSQHHRSSILMWSGLAAACLAAATLGIAIMTHAPTQLYRTAEGQSREIALKDGSALHLEPGTRVRVRLSDKGRRLDLASGGFEVRVAHDAARPFVVHAGDQVTEDIGTVFSVSRRDGEVRVRVTEGKVAVRVPGRTEPAVLGAGAESRYTEASRTLAVRMAADAASRVRPARAVYNDQPLDYVARDLSRYFDKPIVVEEGAGSLRVTAVIKLDSEDAVVKRLEAFLPVEAVSEKDRIILRRRAS